MCMMVWIVMMGDGDDDGDGGGGGVPWRRSV